jgi:predicted enzyme related to lactoylglutathione lyase
MSVQGRVVWHDLYSADVDKSKRFYGELFGWRIQPEGQWNFIYAGNEKDHFGMVAPLMRPGMPSHWLPYVAVENLDGAVGLVTKAGGKVHMGKTPAGKTGNFAVVADPQQATFVLWQYTEGQPKPEMDVMRSMAEMAGHFCWDELLTSDPDAAEKFYGEVVGWEAEHMEMPGMRYTLLNRKEKRPDGKQRQGGGMMKMPPGVPHPFWLSYVAVADCDQSVEKAKKLGATITSPAMDIPNVGRFATMLDPTMAAIAVLGPNK